MDFVCNAIVTHVSLTIADHGVLSGWLSLDYGNSGQGFGGWSLYLPKSFSHHTLESPAGHFICRCIAIAGVEKWEDIPGKTIRVKKTDEWGEIISIGHIVKDDWFNPRLDFEPLKKTK